MSIEVLGEVSGLGYGLAVLASLLVFPLLVAWLGVRGPIRREVEAQASLLMMTGLAAAMLWLVMPSLLYAFVLDSSTATTQPSPATTSPSVSLTGAQRAWLSATVPLLPLLMMVSVFFSSPARVQGLGLRQADFGRGAAIGIGALLVILPLVWSMSAITLVLWESLGYTHPRAHDLLVTYHDDKSDRLTRSVVWFAAVVAAPLFEELLFRGCLQTALSSALRRHWTGLERLARWAAIILVSLVFALVHPWWTQPIIFALSLAIGWVYERTGNLWAAIIAHAAFNATSTLISIYTPQPTSA